MKKQLTSYAFIISLVFSYSITMAQDFQDLALLFSQNNPGGSARVQGIGGAHIALGGDISNTYSNPAGLGMFNRSVFGISTELDFIGSETSYLNTVTPDSKVNFNIPNLGVVIHKTGREGQKLKAGALGITYNRTTSFHNRTTFSSRNNSTSMLDYFLDYAQGVDADIFYDDFNVEYDYPEALAVRAQLIFPSSEIDPTNGSDDEYVTDIYGLPRQSETIETSGAMSQFSIGYGANYDDILFFGGNIGITSISYSSETTYTESAFEYNDPDYSNPLNSFSLEERLNISGGGINATLGVMFRPMDYIQVGGSFTTPTYYTIEDEFDRTLFADFVTYEDQYAESNIILSNYNLTTPLKLSGGITFFAGTHGFISADIEMLNYSKSKLSSQDFSTAQDNQDIRGRYDKSYNYRVGGEYRYDIFRVRAGYAFYENGINGISKGGKQMISGGVGVRMNKYFFDLSVVNTTSDSSYSPYVFSDGSGPIAEVSKSATQGVISFGVNF